jgi:threonine synthase
MKHVWFKDESQLPTGSFKSRGMALATTMARHFGRTRIAMASNGNAGGAMAMQVPSALGDFMVLDTVRESGGLAVAVEESHILGWQKKVASLEGLMICPEAATCVGDARKTDR